MKGRIARFLGRRLRGMALGGAGCLAVGPPVGLVLFIVFGFLRGKVPLGALRLVPGGFFGYLPDAYRTYGRPALAAGLAAGVVLPGLLRWGSRSRWRRLALETAAGFYGLGISMASALFLGWQFFSPADSIAVAFATGFSLCALWFAAYRRSPRLREWLGTAAGFLDAGDGPP